MDTAESSAPHAHHPSTEDHDDTLEAHYACLERPHACVDGWVFVGYIDEHGVEHEASYRCRRCADSPTPIAYAATTSEGIEYSTGLGGLCGAPALCLHICATRDWWGAARGINITKATKEGK